MSNDDAATAQSGLRDVSGAFQEAVARDVGWPGILGKGTKRLPLVGPLLRPVLARDAAPARGGSLSCCRGLEGRPVLGAGAVTGRLAVSVLVEALKSHAARIDQGLSLRRVRDTRWHRSLRHRATRECQADKPGH